MKMYSYVDVVLRVPPLFVIDELLKNMGPSPSPNDASYFWDEARIGSFDFKRFAFSSFKFCLAIFGCLMSLCIFMLWTRNLIKVYLFLLSVGFVLMSYWSNFTCLQSALALSSSDASSEQFMFLFGLTNVYLNLAIQSMLQGLFTYIHQGPRHPIIQKLLPFCFIGPSLLLFLPLSPSILEHVPLFAAILPLSLVQFVLWTATIPAVQAMQSGFQHVRVTLSNYGMATFVETEWTRLNVPRVLLTFWVLRVAEHAVILIDEHLRSGDSSMSPPALFLDMTKSLLVSGCDTLTAVLGMTSVVSHLCYYMGCLFQWALLSEEDEEKPIGTVSAMLFYILALQAGLTSCDPDSRLVRLSRNFCLLFTALLHFVHNYVHPLLLSLSASRNPALHRHLRALGVCVFLISFPITLLVYLWSHHNVSTWLLAVSAFSIEVIVKVMVSLMIYALFLLDAYRSTFWEKLDDYVYYIRAFGHVVEFSFGILLFMNSAWVLVFEAGGAVRAVMVGIHAYFNIWCDAQAGWRVFMKRRTAVNKINSLPEATSLQLQELNDVCSICYQDMRSAKITRCNHFFHGVCLRKWLYVQDRCPLCHDILYRVSSQD